MAAFQLPCGAQPAADCALLTHQGAWLGRSPCARPDQPPPPARQLSTGLVAEWTTGGNCQSLVTILRLQQGGELVGKAQLKYR